MRLEALFKQPHVLPSMPELVRELIDSFNKEDVSIDEIVTKINRDPVLTARMLRLANSAYYHVSRSIGTVEDAMTMLGFVTVRTLIISSGLTNGFKNVKGLDLKQFWRYSINTASLARWLARPAQANGDLAFTIGLMHAIGELIMHAGMPDAMAQINQISTPTDPRRSGIEQAAFGYDFSTVGAELARLWKFPPVFPQTLLGFPNPLEADNFDPTAAVVHLAVWRARAEENHLAADDLASSLPASICQKLALKPSLMLEDMPPLSEISAGLEEMVAA